MKQSKRFTWNKQDTMKFLTDTLRVIGPYLIVIIPVVIEKFPKEATWTVIAVFLLQRVRAAVELFLAGKK
jgi:hypothetical protein